MTKTTVTGDIKQTLDAHLNFRTKLTFHFKFIVDDGTDGIQLIIIPFIYFLLNTDTCFVKNILSGERPIPKI